METPEPSSSAAGGADLEGACAALFERHRVEAFGGTFHVPDVDRYPALFSWDSGYHALALVHLRPQLAVDELTTARVARLVGPAGAGLLQAAGGHLASLP